MKKDNFFSRLLEAMDLVNDLSKKGNTDYWIFKHIQCVNLDLINKKLLRSYYIARSCFTDVNTTNFIFQSRDWNKERIEKEAKRVGLASSINIKEFAKEKGWEDCFKCKAELEFNEEMGWYKCPSCGVKGGIRKLVENNI